LRNLKELEKAQRRKRWLETEYPLLLKAFAVSSHLDITGLHSEPLLQRLAEVNHKASLLRMQRKIRKIKYPGNAGAPREDRTAGGGEGGAAQVWRWGSAGIRY
jgi:hypothetical protein